MFELTLHKQLFISLSLWGSPFTTTSGSMYRAGRRQQWIFWLKTKRHCRIKVKLNCRVFWTPGKAVCFPSDVLHWGPWPQYVSIGWKSFCPWNSGTVDWKMSPETRRVANEWNFSFGWAIRLIRTKQKAAVYGRQCVRPTRHMEHIMVVSHSSCSTTFEHYPISLTHDSHNLNNLPTAEHSASILLLSPTIAKERLFKVFSCILR